MVDPRVLHQVTVEIATGFLTLAGISVALKLVSDLWLRRFKGRFFTLDRWSRSVGRFAEPTAFVALALGVITSFATSYTGLNVWPSSMLWSDPTVRNKMLLVAVSTTLFLGALALRIRFRARLWRAASAGGLYAGLVLAGNVALILQNSVGGHLQGTGSLLDDALAMVHVDETVLWTLPSRVALACIVGFPLVVLVIGLMLRAANRTWARREIGPLAREVKGLLADAQRADLGVDGPRRLIGRANFAIRKGSYARAVRLLERAKDGLLVAPPLPGSVDGLEFWAGRDLPARNPAAMDGPDGAASLPGAVGIVEGSLKEFEGAPILRLQAELRAARDALLEVRDRGWDLREPVRMLREVHEHLQRAEWNEAIEALEEFRRDLRRASEAGLVALPRDDEQGSSSPPTDET